MESLTRLVSESLARHGFDRPLDYRRLHWSRWFRCESHHSLLSVPSKPGVFAVAEEIMTVGTAVIGSPAEQSSAPARTPKAASPDPAACESPRMLAVTKFFEDDDMAFTLDRMLSWQNPMRARLESRAPLDTVHKSVPTADETSRQAFQAVTPRYMRASDLSPNRTTQLMTTPPSFDGSSQQGRCHQPHLRFASPARLKKCLKTRCREMRSTKNRVGAERIELSTNGLRVRCSTS